MSADFRRVSIHDCNEYGNFDREQQESQLRIPGQAKHPQLEPAHQVKRSRYLA
jgi:hypothetical protein